MHSNAMPARPGPAFIVRASGAAGIVLLALALATPVAACSARSAPGNLGAPRHGRDHAVLAVPAAAGSQHPPRQHQATFQTKRTFRLGAGRATRTFTFREQGGVIRRNQLTVRHGVRVFVDARSPDTSVLKIWSWARRNEPSLSCRRHGGFDICTQGEEWCPMPQATWHFRLVKLSGPAGPVRFNYVVAAPPAGFSG
jgi:hypothetical protein